MGGFIGTMKTIKLLGQEVKIAFNLATQIAYERIRKQPFSIEALNNTESAVVLYAACIIANNDKTSITIENLLKDATAPEIAELSKAVVESVKEWCQPVKEEKQKKGTKQKN